MILSTRAFQDEVFCEKVCEQAGQSCGTSGGGYEDIDVCRKAVARTEEGRPSAVVLETTSQQKTYASVESVRTKKVSLCMYQAL